MIYLKEKGLGQESFNAQSVFSFFLNEYQPVGPVLTKGLRAPEAQLFDAPKLINYVNGLFSLTQFGLADCEYWGTGFGSEHARYYIQDYPDGGEFTCSMAKSNNPGVPLRLRYTPLSWGGSSNVNNAPTSAIIEDIDLLLTGGKLSGVNKAIMEDVYDSVHQDSGSDVKALYAVIEHFVATPEFHITNNLFSSKAVPNARPLPDIDIPQDPKPVTEYKAIVYMFLSGAMDSFSALVPLNCELHNQYLEVRGDIAITSGLRQIDASGSNQPCDTFGLHPSLVNIHQLFHDGDASFFANIGVSL
jgi:cullin-associated NEDD8-dissociated protein 1